MAAVGLFVLVLSLVGIAVGSIISVPPVDTTSCYGGMATFYCESNHSDVLGISWLINSNIITEQDKQMRGITINETDNIFSIMGLPINNGIFVGCIVHISSPPYGIPAGATFTVTDIPPVEDLNIMFNHDTMTCTWSQPSCVPVNLCYHITINNESIIVTDTTVQYNISSCQNYNVSVTVMDRDQPQYHSDNVTKEMETDFIGAPTDIELAGSPVVTFDTINECNVTVPLKINVPDPISCQIPLSETFNQFLPPDNDIKFEKFFLNQRLISFNATTGIGIYDFGNYLDRLKGNCELAPQKNNESEPLDFDISTFNVQNFIIIPLSDGTTDITCVFAENSFADGCIVILTNDNQNITVLINKTTNDDDNNATSSVIITNGNYNITVYDVIDNEQNDIPAYSTSTSITHHIVTLSGSGTTAIPTATATTTTAITTTTQSVSSTLSLSEPSVTATDLVVSKHTDSMHVIIGSVVGGGIIILIIIVIVNVLVFKFICNMRNKKQSVRIHGEQALVMKPGAQCHVYVDPVTILQTRPDLLVNNRDEYFQLPSTFLEGSSTVRPPTLPPPSHFPPSPSSPSPSSPSLSPPHYNEVSETQFDYQFSSNNDSNHYHKLENDSTTTTDSSPNYHSTPSTSYSEVDSTDIEPKIKFPEPDILKPPHRVTKVNLPPPVVRVPEGPKLMESNYAEIQLEGFKRPMPRLPEDVVAYFTVKKEDQPPPLPPKQQQQQQTICTPINKTLSVEHETQKGNNNNIPQPDTTTGIPDDDYYTEPTEAIDHSNHSALVSNDIPVGELSVENSVDSRGRTGSNTSILVSGGIPILTRITGHGTDINTSFFFYNANKTDKCNDRQNIHTATDKGTSSVMAVSNIISHSNNKFKSIHGIHVLPHIVAVASEMEEKSNTVVNICGKTQPSQSLMMSSWFGMSEYGMISCIDVMRIEVEDFQEFYEICALICKNELEVQEANLMTTYVSKLLRVMMMSLHIQRKSLAVALYDICKDDVITVKSTPSVVISRISLFNTTPFIKYWSEDVKMFSYKVSLLSLIKTVINNIILCVKKINNTNSCLPFKSIIDLFNSEIAKQKNKGASLLFRDYITRNEADFFKAVKIKKNEKKNYSIYNPCNNQFPSKSNDHCNEQQKVVKVLRQAVHAKCFYFNNYIYI